MQKRTTRILNIRELIWQRLYTDKTRQQKKLCFWMKKPCTRTVDEENRIADKYMDIYSNMHQFSNILHYK